MLFVHISLIIKQKNKLGLGRFTLTQIKYIS